MSNERIYVVVFGDDPCKDCEVKEFNQYCSGCPDKEEYSHGFTRQEAIERMAKGMFIANWQGRYSWDNTDYAAKKHFIVWAEAALNALLEGK